MADEQRELRRINWTQIFSATHIFKSFKMAIHPSKLALAMAAVIIIFCTGWIMDGLWDISDQRVGETEISVYVQQSTEQFDRYKADRLEGRLDSAARCRNDAQTQKDTLKTYIIKIPPGTLRDSFNKVVREASVEKSKNETAEEISKDEDDYSALLEEADDLFDDQLWRIDDLLDKAEDEAKKTIKAMGDDEIKSQEMEKLEKALQAAQLAKTQLKIEFARKVKAIEGGQIFASLLAYETECVKGAVRSVLRGNIFGGMKEYREIRQRRSVEAMSADLRAVIPMPARTPTDDQAGFVVRVLLAGHGIGWLISEHWVYGIIFLVISLSVIALFGGAIHRIAALHFARDEKISIAQAVSFAASKFLSFFTAPLIPIAIIFLLGALLALGGLLGNIPWIGMAIMGVLFFLAIILGLLIAFLLVGLVAGFPLMYPTIAVEGSDSFDAISRSFSYIFGRPWRAALYGLISLVYGAVTFTFVWLFAYVALAATHCFVKWGVFVGGSELPVGSDVLDEVWAAPTFDNLTGPATCGSSPIASWLIGVWVFLVAAGVLAYLLSYAASSTTVIYYLLRRKEDATDLDDVYIEDLEEEEFFEEPIEQEEEPEDD